jgi:hypothetical protein
LRPKGRVRRRGADFPILHFTATTSSKISNLGDLAMQDAPSNLDQMQSAYMAAVEEWIAAIKQEEALASVNHSIAEIDKWEEAHFKEDDIRSKVKAAKKQYEDALREKFFGF